MKSWKKQEVFSGHSGTANGKEKIMMHLHSDAVAEIINKSPGFIEKWGLLMFICILLLLLAVTWVIQFPDTIVTNTYLKSNDPPKQILCGYDGRLLKFLVHNGEQVKTNQVVAMIETSTTQAEVTSLAEGKFVLMRPLQSGQFLEKGNLLGYIVPNTNLFYAYINVVQKDIDKIDTGLQVKIRLDAYPYQKFGFLSGKLEFISEIVTDSGFLGIVRLDPGLFTNRRYPIQCRDGLKGEAIIIIHDRKLLQGLYRNIMKRPG